MWRPGAGPRVRGGVGLERGRRRSGGREDGVEGVFAAHHEVQVRLGQVAEAAVKDDGERDVVQGGVLGASKVSGRLPLTVNR